MPDARNCRRSSRRDVYKRQDTALALTAFADEHEHFLPLGGRQQTVTEKFLQGGNVLRLQQLGQELQPLLGNGCVRVVGDRQAIVAVVLVGGCLLYTSRCV